MKLLASDFDGTLYFRENEPNFRPEDLKAIKKFREAGNLFGLCTGRPLKGLLPFISDELTFDFYILNSGAVVFDKDLNTIIENAIPLYVLEDVIDKYGDLGIFIMAKDCLMVYNLDDRIEKHVANFIRDKKDLEGHTILGFSFGVEDPQKLKEVMGGLQKYPEISVYQNVTAIDCVAKDCSKRTGLAFIEKYFQLDKKDMACIGDSYNDLPMLTYLENSFTFDYSPLEVQNQCRHVVSKIADAIDILMK